MVPNVPREPKVRPWLYKPVLTTKTQTGRAGATCVYHQSCLCKCGSIGLFSFLWGRLREPKSLVVWQLIHTSKHCQHCDFQASAVRTADVYITLCVLDAARTYCKCSMTDIVTITTTLSIITNFTIMLFSCRNSKAPPPSAWPPFPSMSPRPFSASYIPVLDGQHGQLPSLLQGANHRPASAGHTSNLRSASAGVLIDCNFY
eukprot:1157297-Pelagomonas_calceolata.AAC.6